MSEDMTFCLYSKCPNNKCERHASNIKHREVPHSYTYFTGCVWWAWDLETIHKNDERGEVE